MAAPRRQAKKEWGIVRLAFTVSALFFVSGIAAAQIPIDITRKPGRIPIAVPDFATAPGHESLGRELAEVIRYDLGFTGLFDLIPPERFPRTFTGFTQDVSRIDFPAWRETKAEFLVYAHLSPDGDRIGAECRLFDTGGQQVVGKQFTAESTWRRALAHHFSDEIVLYLTGVPGIATSQICFSSAQKGQKEICVVDYDGANLRQVTKHGSISILPEFSPEGTRIAYLSFKDRYPFLYILDLPTGQSSLLSKEVGLNAAPAWAPDGNALAMVLSKDANAEIYLVQADRSEKRRLTNHPAVDTSPTFHPNGKEIAFASDRDGVAQIFAMGIDGKNCRRLSYQGGRSYDPVWSPDGKSVTYVVDKAGDGLEIYVMDADGANPRRLTNSPGGNESPSWSPDSRHIVFASTRRGTSELWTVNVETGEQRPVPNLAGLQCQGPSWGPRRK